LAVKALVFLRIRTAPPGTKLKQSTGAPRSRGTRGGVGRRRAMFRPPGGGAPAGG
jgi:hypothetical protein